MSPSVDIDDDESYDETYAETNESTDSSEAEDDFEEGLYVISSICFSKHFSAPKLNCIIFNAMRSFCKCCFLAIYVYCICKVSVTKKVKGT